VLQLLAGWFLQVFAIPFFFLLFLLGLYFDIFRSVLKAFAEVVLVSVLLPAPLSSCLCLSLLPGCCKHLVLSLLCSYALSPLPFVSICIPVLVFPLVEPFFFCSLSSPLSLASWTMLSASLVLLFSSSTSSGCAFKVCFVAFCKLCFSLRCRFSLLLFLVSCVSGLLVLLFVCVFFSSALSPSLFLRLSLPLVICVFSV